MSKVCESTLDGAIGWLFASAREKQKPELLLTPGSSCCWLLLLMGFYPVDLVMAVCLGGGLLRVVACCNGGTSVLEWCLVIQKTCLVS